MTKEERQKAIKERIQAEEGLAQIQKENIRELMLQFLKDEKGYSDEDIEIDRKFIIEGDDRVSVDFIIKLQGKRLIAIKCTPTSLESRERHIIAFSRVVDNYQIPLSVVTDSIHARVLDTISGRLISEEINSIPSKTEIKIDDFEMRCCPSERLEKEKRILLAFESISCSIIY